ncbi:MAG: ACT domain-containing protein, partial [Alphaproteobacteria bacterium]|nr:ACT domain-containing protein [Alphaproteobacteria bacterium]
VGLLISGGNIDARLLATVLMRGLVREGRLQRLRIEVSDIPGSLADVTEIIGAAEANIVEIHHRRLFQDVPVKLADLDVIVETHNRDHGEEILARLKAAGFEARLLTSRALDPSGDIGG